MTENESDEPERVLFCLGAKSRIRRFFAWLGKLVCAFGLPPAYQNILHLRN